MEEINRLIQNLSGPDLQPRIEALEDLNIIAENIGTARTTEELIPYLLETIDDEDEAMEVLAARVPALLPSVGNANAHLLLPLLEQLASSEEAVVREKATKSITKVVAALPEEAVYRDFLPLVERLSTAPGFSLRASACALIPTCYRSVEEVENRAAIVGRFEELCKDESAMVRRAAAGALKKMVEMVDKVTSRHRLHPLYMQLAHDDQDSVRLLSVAVLPELLCTVKQADLINFSQDQIEAFVSDPAWRVRYMLAEKLVEVQKAMPPDSVLATLLPAFASLLEDREPEVRRCAAGQVYDFCSLLEDNSERMFIIVDSIIPFVQKLAEDDSTDVRAALANGIMRLSPLIGADQTTENLLPSFLKLLRDDDSQVRLNVISRLSDVNQVVGLQHLSKALLPAIEALAQDDKWRVRLAIVEFLPILADQLGVEFFTDKLLKFCQIWLKDSVYAVRLSTIQNLGKIIPSFGQGWVQDVLVPLFTEMSQSPAFVHRLTTLFAMNEFVPACTPEIIDDALFPIVASLADDNIPNVRINVAKTISTIIATEKVNCSKGSRIEEVLSQLKEDSDMDVAFFAGSALDAVEQA